MSHKNDLFIVTCLSVSHRSNTFEDYLGTMWSTTIIKSQKAHSLASYFLPETFNHRYRNASYDIFNAQSFFGVFWSCGRVLPNLLVFIRCQFLFNNREWEERERGSGRGEGWIWTKRIDKQILLG